MSYARPRVNLLDFLTIPGGTPPARGCAPWGHGGQQGGARSHTSSSGQSTPEEFDAHRDKRQRTEENPSLEPPVQTITTTTPSSSRPPPPAVAEWDPVFLRGDRVVNVNDSANSSHTAFAVAKAVALPVDMARAREMTTEDLLKSSMSHSVKTLQKKLILNERFIEKEKEIAALKASLARVEEERLEALNAYKAAVTEHEVTKRSLESTEDSLAQPLSQLETSKGEVEAAYLRGKEEVNADALEYCKE